MIFVLNLFENPASAGFSFWGEPRWLERPRTLRLCRIRTTTLMDICYAMSG